MATGGRGDTTYNHSPSHTIQLHCPATCGGDGQRNNNDYHNHVVVIGEDGGHGDDDDDDEDDDDDDKHLSAENVTLQQV